MWNVAARTNAITFSGHSDWVNSVAFERNGNQLVSGSDDKTIKLWSIYGQVICTLKGHVDGIISVSFNQDGTLLASGSRDWAIKIWHLKSKQEIISLQAH